MAPLSLQVKQRCYLSLIGTFESMASCFVTAFASTVNGQRYSSYSCFEGQRYSLGRSIGCGIGSHH